MPRDYIQRTLEELGRVWRMVVRQRELENYAGALVTLDEGYSHLFNLNARFVDLLSDAELLELTCELGRFQPERAYSLGWLLGAEGEIYDGLGNAEEAYWRFERAMIVFARLVTSDTVVDAQLQPRILDTAARLTAFEPAPPGAWALVETYTALKHFNAAEEALHLWRQQCADQAAARSAAEAWYTQLAAVDDAVLEAGGLTRTDVVAGLAYVST